MRTIDFSLKKQWFDQIRSGRKRVEYRDLSNAYYLNKFVNTGAYQNMGDSEIIDGLKKGKLKPKWREFTHARFHCMGQTMLVSVKGIDIEGNYYAIKLGNVLTGKKQQENVAE